MPKDNTNPLPDDVQKMLAEQLRDVHLPDAISWWPLAWGWWVLLGLMLAIIITSLFFIWRNHANNRYRGFAIKSLEDAYQRWIKDQNTQTYLHHANDILKRCVLHASGSTSLTTHSGQTWVDQLQQWSKKTLSENAKNALAFECYQANPSSDIQSLHNELRYWLKVHNYQLEKPATVKRGLHA